jgi:three-Cys-motif partner protein
MAKSGFHEKPYDAGTLTKLKIFELYVQAWIPVFVSRPDPPFREIHIYDLFCGPGTDSAGTPGSPLRILAQLRSYQLRGMAAWSEVAITVHFSDADERKVEKLRTVLAAPEWRVPGVQVKIDAVSFDAALERQKQVLRNSSAAKLLIIDQFGVDAVTDSVFQQLIRFPRTDFIFFLSSSTLHRFRNHPAIKIKIAKPEDSYDVHRTAFQWFQDLTPADAYLGQFSIKKGSNIYGLIFGSRHPLGAHKFLEVAWANDDIRGEANFDIDRENIAPGDLFLPLADFRPKKIQEFELDLEAELRKGQMSSEADVVHFCIAAGMTCQHASAVLRKLKGEGLLECEFRTPAAGRIRNPRPIRVRVSGL